MTLIIWKLKFTLLQQHLRSPINETFSGFEEESEKERKIHCLSTVFSGNMNNLGLYPYLVNGMFIVFMTQGSGHLEFGIDTKTYQPSLLSNDSTCLPLLVGISDHKAGENKASYTRYMGDIDIKLRNDSWKPLFVSSFNMGNFIFVKFLSQAIAGDKMQQK